MTELALEAKPRGRFLVEARIWWKAVRPFSFPVSAMPAILGIAFAWSVGVAIDPALAVLTLLGAVAAHAGANLLQDYFDFTCGIDKPGKLGGSGILVSGVLGPRAIFTGSVVAFAIAAFIAAPLIVRAGTPLLFIVLAGFLLGAGYAVPRMGFKYYAAGDVAVFLSFGVLITLGSFVIQAGSFSLAPLACGIPFGFLVVAVLVANNMRDEQDDRNAGVRTLAVIMGGRATRVFYIALILAAFAAPIACARAGLIPAGALFSLAALPSAYGVIMRVWRAPDNDRRAMASADGETAKLALFYGALMAAGMVAWRYALGG